MNPYQDFVNGFDQTLREGRSLPLGGIAPAPRPKLHANAPKALFFAPHPDDECISGGIALRLLREAGMKVVNVAVTQGSKKERQIERFRELAAACNYVGFDLVATAPNGLEKINPKTRQTDPGYWAGCVKIILSILQEHKPRVVICPHDKDWNSTHIGTHSLVMDALRQMPADYECYLVETEFWGQMTDPNLMVEIGATDLADLIAATTFHVGEVERNPYH
ncbi:MAG TPA: PIG-L family deacetylase, partial [Clostridia bacterium]|nr:PIG-L family deacetylase [Clostridia bacterium]